MGLYYIVIFLENCVFYFFFLPMFKQKKPRKGEGTQKMKEEGERREGKERKGARS